MVNQYLLNYSKTFYWGGGGLIKIYKLEKNYNKTYSRLSINKCNAFVYESIELYGKKIRFFSVCFNKDEYYVIY